MSHSETAPQQVTAAPDGAPAPHTPSAANVAANSSVHPVMDIGQIMSILPHRYPFLLIDRVLEIERRQRIIAIKNVTINEPFFQGHFPDYPIMPGVLVIEAIAQAGGALLLTEFPDRAERLMVFTGIENARFRRPVVPGDQLRFEVTVVQWRSRAVKMLGIATVEGKVACEATIMCQLVPHPAKRKATPDSPAGEESRAAAEALKPAAEELKAAAE